MKDKKITRDAVLEKVRKRIKKYYNTRTGAHDLEHTQRVLKLALKIASAEKADKYIVELACWVHDIARHTEDRDKGRTDHAVLGAKRSVPLLLECGVSPEDAESAAECVRTHRFRGNAEPVTKEAKVLFDADKLDSIGAVGIGRAFQFAGEVGAKLHNPETDIGATKPYTEDDTAYREYMVKLRFVKDRMLTETGKKLAVKRNRIMDEFFMELTRETQGRA